MGKVNCRFCGALLKDTFVNLGMSPLSNAYVPGADLVKMEVFFPFMFFVCSECRLVQLPECARPESIFSDYAYFSSYSDGWLRHASSYVDRFTKTQGLDASSLVVELASNDGYLLQYFLRKGIPVLGIEPAANVARVAIEKGIQTLVQFFGRESARQLKEGGRQADLIVANNVLAHVPDLNDFVAGITILLKPEGLATLEFPHLWRMIRGNQFDTIYHEHYSYFSLLSVTRVMERHGLRLFDVEELPTHGGSLRIHVGHANDATKKPSSRVDMLREREIEAGFDSGAAYAGFQEQVDMTKRRLLSFLIGAKDDGKSVAGYGAPAKGNTLLNYCGIRGDLLAYTVDRNPNKAGKFLPGTHIPIHFPSRILETRPDYLLILPWNLRDEITAQMTFIREWGGQFVTPIPRVEVIA